MESSDEQIEFAFDNKSVGDLVSLWQFSWNYLFTFTILDWFCVSIAVGFFYFGVLPMIRYFKLWAKYHC